MKLNYKEYPGPGETLLILHGLFGSLGNWNWHSKMLSQHFRVFAVDLRNHGNSPHSERMDYTSMAADVLELLDDLQLTAVNLLGHSMGGKVAMQLALTCPERVVKLVVADIAPVNYGSEHETIFKGLQGVNLAKVTSRAQADAQLAQQVPDEVVRQFLLTNLQRDAEGHFNWRINLQALAANYAHLREPPAAPGVFDKPVLFLKGDWSDYLLEEYREAIMARFPQAQLKTILQAGHWLHAEKPQTFYRLVAGFLGVDESAMEESK
ncbi:MAG: alpha/beta fold hydrolase [Pseudomonadales bacterium]|nr:alpha/beta fold hydrolase [Pseudomonadales bacterium]